MSGSISGPGLSNDLDLKVLRQRRYLVAASVVVDEELLDSLHSEGLINEEQLNVITSTTKPRERSVRLVEQLIQSGRQFSLYSFCECLDSKYPSLTKQLIGTMRAECGELQTDSHTQREADIIVFKTFGSSRRLSERDKKRMANIIATRSLIGQQDQLKQLQYLNQQIRHLTQRYMSAERQVTELNTRLKTYIRQNQLKKIGAFVDLRSTSEALTGKDGLSWTTGTTEGGSGASALKEPVHELEAIVNFILSKFSRIIVEKECAQYNVENLEMENKAYMDQERQRKRRQVQPYKKTAAASSYTQQYSVDSSQLYYPDQQMTQQSGAKQKSTQRFVDDNQMSSAETKNQKSTEQDKQLEQLNEQQQQQQQQQQHQQQKKNRNKQQAEQPFESPSVAGLLPAVRSDESSQAESSSTEDIESLRLKVRELEAKVEKREKSLQKLIRIS